MSLPVVAHRGNCESAYENSLESIQAALEAGVKYIEIDIQFTQDLKPIVFHDATWQRMTGKKGRVSHTSSVDLFQFMVNQANQLKGKNKAIQPARIVFLDEVIALIRHYAEVTLFVEVKEEIFQSCTYKSCLKVLTPILQTLKDQIVMISFSYRFLRLCKKQSIFTLGYVLPYWRSYNEKMLYLLQPAYIFCDVNYFPSDFYINKTNPTWVLYEVSCSHDIKQYIKQGVGMIETYFPQTLQKHVASL